LDPCTKGSVHENINAAKNAGDERKCREVFNLNYFFFAGFMATRRFSPQKRPVSKKKNQKFYYLFQLIKICLTIL
jgi:hypothetical protein